MEERSKFSKGKMKEHPTYIRVVPILFIVFSIFLQSAAIGAMSSVEPAEQINSSTVDAPVWEVGDWWNYTFQYNSTVEEHSWGNDWMYLDGNFNRSVVGVENVVVEGDELDCYVVEHQRHYEIEGINHDENTGFNITMDMVGVTTGVEYFHIGTLELVKASYESNMTGVSGVVGMDIELDVVVEDKTEVKNPVQGDFFSFPLDTEDTWDSYSEYMRCSRTWTNITGMDNEYEEEEYPVENDYPSISVTSVEEKEVDAGVFDAFYIEAEHDWSVNESEEHSGTWEKYYSHEAGNLVYVNMTEVYHDAFGMNIDYGSIELYGFSHTPSQPEYDFSVCVDEKEKTVRQGDSVEYIFTLKNDGDRSDTYNVEKIQGNEWGTLDKTDFHLDVDESEIILLNVSVPLDAETDDYLFEVEFSSEGGVTKRIEVVTEVIPLDGDIRVSIDTVERTVLAGETAEYTFEVENRYDHEMDTHIEIVEGGSGWASIEDGSVLIDTGDEKEVSLMVHVPSDAEEGVYMDTLRFTTDAGDEIIRSVNTTVEVLNYDFEASVDEVSKEVIQGTDVDYTISVKNTGDIEDTISIVVDSSPHLDIDYPDEMEVGSEVEFMIGICTTEVPPGRYDITVTLTSIGDEELSKELELELTVIEREYSIKVEVDSTYRQTYIDTSLEFMFTVTNMGNVEDTILVENEDEWSTLTDEAIDLAASDRMHCSLQINVPEDAETGEYSFEVLFRSQGDPEVEEKMQLTISVSEGIPYGVPTWNEGDRWTYRYYLNASSSSIQEMYQEGEVTFTVEGEETIHMGDETYRVYNVSYRKTAIIEGVTDQGGVVGEVDFEMDGFTHGNLYYRRRDLEIVRGEFRNYMDGISIAVGIEIDINITDTSHMQTTFTESFFNSPIELGNSWERNAVYDRYSDMYTSFDPSGSPYPDNEHEENEFKIEHDQKIEAVSELMFSIGEDDLEVIELAGTDRWTMDGDEETEGSFRKYYSRHVGNFVYYQMEDMFDQETGLNVFDKHMVLVDHEHQYREVEDYDMEVYAEEDVVYCRPGDEMRFELNVRNSGRFDDIIEFELDGENWAHSWDKEYLELEAGSSATLTLCLEVPDDIESNSDHTITVLFTSMSQPEITKSIQLNASIRDTFEPIISNRYPPVRDITRIEGGDDVSFSISARCLGGGDLMISWYVNGELVETGADEFVFTPDKNGEFTVTSRVTNGEEESTARWDISVREPSSTNPIMYVMIGSIVLIIASVALFLYRRKRKREDVSSEDEDIEEDSLDENAEVKSEDENLEVVIWDENVEEQSWDKNLEESEESIWK